MLSRITALQILDECNGDDVWSIAYCEQRDIPTAWIEELVDCYESGFASDRLTLYVDDQVVNQYEGVRDVDLACKLGEFLGVHTAELVPLAISRSHLVRKIKEAVEEG